MNSNLKTQLVEVSMIPTRDITQIKRNLYCFTEAHGNPLSFGVIDNAVERGFEYQHLFITTDETPREGDWYLNGKHVYQADSFYEKAKYDRKIIAATDISLRIKKFESGVLKNLSYSLPQIPQEFIKEYCKIGGISKASIEINDSCCKCDTQEKVLNCVYSLGDIEGTCTVPNPNNDFYGLNPKVSKDNVVNLLFIKEHWNREEVERLLKLMYTEFASYPVMNLDLRDNWIKNNL